MVWSFSWIKSNGLFYQKLLKQEWTGSLKSLYYLYYDWFSPKVHISEEWCFHIQTDYQYLLEKVLNSAKILSLNISNIAVTRAIVLILLVYKSYLSMHHILTMCAIADFIKTSGK